VAASVARWGIPDNASHCCSLDGMRQTLTAVRIPVDMAAALKLRASESGVTHSQLIRSALADWLAAGGVEVRRQPYREQRQT
jgi:hypothetical protein